MLIFYIILVSIFIWLNHKQNYLKVLNWYDNNRYGPQPIYKHKIGFLNHGVPRSVETYPIQHPIGFLKKWENN